MPPCIAYSVSLQNKKYELGLIAAVKSMRKQGRPCNVLDIGTGTGLLSMMAVRNGADTVHACDVSNVHELIPTLNHFIFVNLKLFLLVGWMVG